MRWLIASVFLLGSGFYLYRHYRTVSAGPQTPPERPAALAREGPSSFLSVDEIRKIRRSTHDGTPEVRWAAIDLLFMVKDPESIPILERAVSEDPDPSIRLRAIELLKNRGTVDALQGLIRGLKDSDKDVRLASLQAIAAVGDPAATPWVTEALKDSESDVKMEALHTLGRFQDKRKEDYARLAEQLRAQYEAAVKKAQENN